MAAVLLLPLAWLRDLGRLSCGALRGLAIRVADKGMEGEGKGRGDLYVNDTTPRVHRMHQNSEIEDSARILLWQGYRVGR